MNYITNDDLKRILEKNNLGLELDSNLSIDEISEFIEANNIDLDKKIYLLKEIVRTEKLRFKNVQKGFISAVETLILGSLCTLGASILVKTEDVNILYYFSQMYSLLILGTFCGGLFNQRKVKVIEDAEDFIELESFQLNRH